MPKPDDAAPPRRPAIAALADAVETITRRLLSLEKRASIDIRVGPAYRLAEGDKVIVSAREVQIGDQRFRIPCIEE